MKLYYFDILVYFLCQSLLTVKAALLTGFYVILCLKAVLYEDLYVLPRSITNDTSTHYIHPILSHQVINFRL